MSPKRSDALDHVVLVLFENRSVDNLLGYNMLDEHNRFKIGEAVKAPWNVPPPGTEPTMDGFVTDYIT